MFVEREDPSLALRMTMVCHSEPEAKNLVCLEPRSFASSQDDRSAKILC